MEKTEVITGESIEINGLTVIPVVRVILDSRACGGRNLAFGSKYPVAVIVANGTTKKVFRITGEEISPEKLTEEFPDARGLFSRLPPVE